MKLGYLDGLRGSAALVVVFSHFCMGFYSSLHTGFYDQMHNRIELIISGSPFNIVYNGSFAVYIFFILSGYVLSCKYWIGGGISPISWILLIIKRYIRLSVLIIVSVFISFIMLKFNLYFNLQLAITRSPWLLAQFNFSSSFIDMIQEAFYKILFIGQSSYNGVLWTMKYEFYGSIMVYAFIMLFGRYKFRLWSYPILVFIFWKSHYLAFFLGMILSDLNSGEKNYLQRVQKLSVWFVGFGLFFGSFPFREQFGSGQTMYGFLKYDFLKIDDFYVFYHVVGSFLFMIALLNSNRMKIFFNNKFNLFLGKISFSIYSIHLLVICSFSSSVFGFLITYLSYNLSFIITFILSLFLIFVFGIVLNKYVDFNGVMLANYISNKIKMFIIRHKLSIQEKKYESPLSAK